MDTPAFTLKFVLLGDEECGKTALSSRLTKGIFSSEYIATERLQFSSKEYVSKSLRLKAQIWDTTGKSRPEGMTRAYFKDAVGAALVYDAHSQKSFDNIQKIWIPQLTAFGHSAMPMILVANKLDDGDQSDRIVSSEAGIQLAREHSCSYVEVSAKTNFNVDVMFRRLIFSVAIVIPSIQAAINADELPPGWISVGSDRSSGDVYSNYWTGETAAIKPTGPAPVSVGGSLDAYINTDINLRDSFCDNIAGLSVTDCSTGSASRNTNSIGAASTFGDVDVEQGKQSPNFFGCSDRCSVS